MKNSKILPQIKRINALIVVNAILLVVALCLFNYSDVDLEIQKYLFDFGDKTWLIDKDEPVAKFIFYKFPKILFGVGIVVCLLASFIGFRGRKEILKQAQDDGVLIDLPRYSELVSGSFFAKNRHRFFIIFFGLSLIPLIAGNIKKFTNIYCPNQLEIYNGSKPYVRIFDPYPADFWQTKKGQCFPAGHAITGFALMILFFAFVKKSHRLWGLASGVVLGWIMGFYQMAKGAHFLSDTLVSMLVCFLLAAIIYKIYLQVMLSPLKHDSGPLFK